MSGIDSDLIRGHIDTIILKSLYHGDKYGLEIIQEVEEKSKGTYELKQPTLYSCLKRLESQGLISSYWEDSDIGGKRHYYKLTEKGLETYKANQEEWLRSRAIIDNLIYNTTVDYAKIYEDRPGEEPKEEAKNKDSEEEFKQEETEQTNEQPEEEKDYVLSADEEDDFASFDNAATAGSNFFDSNNEESSVDDEDDDLDETDNTPILTSNGSEEHEEVINLNLDDDIDNEPLLNESDSEEEMNNDKEEQTQDELESSNYYSATNLLDDETEQEPAEEENDDEIYSPEDTMSDDDEIYSPESDVDYVEDEQPQIEEPVKEENDDEEISYSPTYINFGQDQNTEEADITNIEDEQSDEEQTYERIKEPDGPSIEETAASINEQFYSAPAQHASAEEINKLYHTTENYENLQAGYTDESYKQMLNELESYGGGTVSSAPVKHDLSNVKNYDDLKAELEKDGITISKHERYAKESDDTKLYVKTNELNLIKNWMVWGATSLALLIIFAILNPFKSTYSYDFAFWQFAVAMAVSLVLPGYTTVKYFMNPYKKSVAKYAPRLSILINLLITVQLIVIVYCVNLQVGFYSFSQENYNHLAWIIPLVLTFIPVLQSLTYTILYNSKKFHV